MDSDLVDLIYQNEAVEGVAIINASNEVEENQLSIRASKVNAIATTLLKLKKGLNDAGREMRGFLIKSDSILLMANMTSEKLILLELSEGSSVNEVERSLRSILGDAVAQPVLAEPAQSEPVAQAALPAVDKVEEEGIDLADFKNSLAKLLKTVAPGKLADGMISKALKDMGIDETAVQLPQDQATKLGYEVIAKVPNKARRKIIENEYTSMLNQ